MITFLADHNIEGQAALLRSALADDGWIELDLLKVVTFVEVELPFASTDREVWRFAQTNGMLLLTGNRNNDRESSLEQTIRDENQPASLPVITISDADRVYEKIYRERCVARIVEIAMYPEKYLGTGRLFIP